MVRRRSFPGNALMVVSVPISCPRLFTTTRFMPSRPERMWSYSPSAPNFPTTSPGRYDEPSLAIISSGTSPT
jgi:hypothetical protein